MKLLKRLRRAWLAFYWPNAIVISDRNQFGAEIARFYPTSSGYGNGPMTCQRCGRVHDPLATVEDAHFEWCDAIRLARLVSKIAA